MTNSHTQTRNIGNNRPRLTLCEARRPNNRLTVQLNVGYYISLACCDQIRTNTCVVSESPPYLSTGRSINFVASSLFTSLHVHVDRINKVMCVVCFVLFLTRDVVALCLCLYVASRSSI